MITFGLIVVGFLLASLGVFMTAFAVGTRESLEKTSDDYNSIGKATRAALFSLTLLTVALLCMSVLISAWFILAFLPSVLIGLSIKSGTEVHEKMNGVTDPVPVALENRSDAVNLPWTPEEVRDGTLRYADLSGLDLHGANLFIADLAGADLTHTDLCDALLSGANLTAAKLNNSFLQGAYLGGAFLTNADLTGANLTLADLGGADLRGASLVAALGLVQSQIDAAMTDASTIVDPHLTVQTG